MRRTAIFILLLSFVATSVAVANTVSPRHLHRRARKGGAAPTAHSHAQHSPGSAGNGKAVSAQRSTSAKAKVASSSTPVPAHAGSRTATRGGVIPAVSGRRRSYRGSHGRSYAGGARLRRVNYSFLSPLAGTRESLIHQNEMAESEGLERIQDDADLESRIEAGSLVPVPVASSLRINQDLPGDRRYCRPWTAAFLRTLAAAHASQFPATPLEVTSAVRTVEYQRRLRRINGNAAAADGDIASPHLTGGTIDLAKKGMSRKEIAWMRAWLLPLQQSGKIDVEEEFRQSCFHISVYKSFTNDAPDAPIAPGDKTPSTVADGAGGAGTPGQ